jgi:hypothetical protein
VLLIEHKFYHKGKAIMTTTDQILFKVDSGCVLQPKIENKPLPVVAPRLRLPASFEIPDGSLLIGQSDDRLPILLNLYHPQPGAFLVTGDAGSGKTRFLQSLARTSDLQEPGDITFGVVTPYPEEWEMLETQPNCLGIWPAYHPSASRFLSLLAGWSEWLPKTRQAVLLLYDGLDLVVGGGYRNLQDLRKIIKKGAQRQVWTFVSANAGRLDHMNPWLKYFPTRVLGQVKNTRSTPLLEGWMGVEHACRLETGQYLMTGDGNCVKFHIPPQEKGELT